MKPGGALPGPSPRRYFKIRREREKKNSTSECHTGEVSTCPAFQPPSGTEPAANSTQQEVVWKPTLSSWPGPSTGALLAKDRY